MAIVSKDHLTVEDLREMKLHEVRESLTEPRFRIMKVIGGFCYNFYNHKKKEYLETWETMTVLGNPLCCCSPV